MASVWLQMLLFKGWFLTLFLLWQKSTNRLQTKNVGSEFSLNHQQNFIYGAWSLDQSTLQTERQVRYVAVNVPIWVRVQLPLTHSRFMSVYQWRLSLHLACSGSKSCTCVTVLRPRMWTDFLLWHLIWLTWHQLSHCGFSQLSLTYRAGNQE